MNTRRNPPGRYIPLPVLDRISIWKSLHKGTNHKLDSIKQYQMNFSNTINDHRNI